MACVRLTFWFQPEMVPSSVAKRKVAGPDPPPCPITKSLVPLKTVPDGADGPLWPGGAGTVTTRGAPWGNGWPVVSYRVETPVTLSPTQKAPEPGLTAKPHGFVRFGSTWGARPETFATR